jgi:hypothetical protein
MGSVQIQQELYSKDRVTTIFLTCEECLKHGGQAEVVVMLPESAPKPLEVFCRFHLQTPAVEVVPFR